MDLNYLKKLIKMLDTSNLAEIELEEEGTKIRLAKPRPKVVTSFQQVPAYSQAAFQNFETPTNESKVSELKAEELKKENYYEVKAPMVGTFYTSPSPEADPYVKVGETVSQGSIICLIEAMKLMNEIESEVAGKIVKVLVENAQAVEFNQTLFLIEKV